VGNRERQGGVHDADDDQQPGRGCRRHRAFARTDDPITLRSNDQFNTTIYGYSDRLRGLEGSRNVVLINRDEMRRLGLTEGQTVSLTCDIDDGAERTVSGLTVTPYDLPPGCVAGYYPELNPLVPLSYHEKHSKTPAYKGTPVRFVLE
jgi:anaerobic selenocysteine-containing dehydrogenase